VSPNGKTVRIPFCVRRGSYVCPQHLLSSNKEVLRPGSNSVPRSVGRYRARLRCRCTTGGPLGSGALMNWFPYFLVMRARRESTQRASPEPSLVGSVRVVMGRFPSPREWNARVSPALYARAIPFVLSRPLILILIKVMHHKVLLPCSDFTTSHLRRLGHRWTLATLFFTITYFVF
jgi:hypothetical protein